MSKDNSLEVNHTKANNLCETLKKRLERDEKRYKYKRCVYMYRFKADESIDDNVILLDYATKAVHKNFLESRFYAFISDVCQSWSFSKLSKNAHDVPFAHYEIIQVGTFDKQTMKFSRVSCPKVIVDCDDLVFKYFEERKNNEKVSH